MTLETQRLANAVGCGEAEGSSDSERMKRCLRAKTPYQLMDGLEKMVRFFGKFKNFYRWHISNRRTRIQALISKIVLFLIKLSDSIIF